MTDELVWKKSINESGIFYKSCVFEAILGIKPSKFCPKCPNVVTLKVNKVPVEKVNTK